MQEEEYKEVEKMMKDQEENEKKEEELRIQKELEEKKQFEIQKQQEELEKAQKVKKLQDLSPEPAENETNIISILFRLPNGSKITRRFRIGEEIQVLVYFFSLIKENRSYLISLIVKKMLGLKRPINLTF